MGEPAVGTLLDLSAEVALVTGASGTIGAAIARRLHEAGAAVLLHASTDISRVEPLAASLQARVGVVAGDVQRDAAALCAQALTAFGRLTILVNNAAIQPVGRLLDLTTQDELEVLRVNLAGVAAMTREAANVMDAGSIVNIASIEGLQPPDSHSHYAASKAGVIMHTRTAAAELGSRGIRVNAVAPGLIDDGTLAERWPEGAARWQACAPLERMGSPMDVADAVLFLVSPAARWVTGSTLVVDGGVLARNTW